MFGHFVAHHFPLEIFLIEMIVTICWDTVSYANINSIWTEETIDLIEHGIAVGARVVSAKYGIKASLVNHNIEFTVFKIFDLFSDIGLHELKIWNLILITLCH